MELRPLYYVSIAEAEKHAKLAYLKGYRAGRRFYEKESAEKRLMRRKIKKYI